MTIQNIWTARAQVFTIRPAARQDAVDQMCERGIAALV